MKYKLWFSNGRTRQPYLEASSMGQVIRTARAILGVSRIYRGSQYQHGGEFAFASSGTALDLWVDARNARREMGVPADCVVTW